LIHCQKIHPVEPIFVIDLFPTLDEKLLDLLWSLDAEDWEKQTIAPLWCVKDIAAHLLDGNIRALSMLRDQYVGEKPEQIDSHQDLVAFLNRLNADWVQAMRRVSPQVLIELLEITGRDYMVYLQQLEPNEPAAFPVAWAGEEQSANWFHIAREYTEKWHHQQQIRLAVGQETPLYEAEFYIPYLETSMRALPHHYRNVSAEAGDCVQFNITGTGGASWWLYREPERWVLIPQNHEPPTCEVTIPGAIAWRIFTKGISKQKARQQVEIVGRQELGNPIFDMLAVMA
jgi:uncharacterized protein (TIGR03083 family)